MYEIDEIKVKNVKDMLAKAELQYERFCASGCSVHEFNRLKNNIKGWLSDYEKGTSERGLIFSENLVKFLIVWVGKRVNIATTSECSNCGITQHGEGWTWFCRDCDKNTSN